MPGASPDVPGERGPLQRQAALGDDKALLDDWNAQLPALADHVTPEGPVDRQPYGTGWRPGDLAGIPEEDLPAGSPPWWRDLRAWATREGETPQLKRATIQVVVPKDAQTWPKL